MNLVSGKMFNIQTISKEYNLPINAVEFGQALSYLLSCKTSAERKKEINNLG